MAQPAVLYMFDKEVKLQASLDNEKRKRAKQLELDSLYNNQKKELNERKFALQSQLTLKGHEVEEARKSYIAEADGTGGTGKVGIDKIALAKQAEYNKLDEEYKLLSSSLQPGINSIDSSIACY